MGLFQALKVDWYFASESKLFFPFRETFLKLAGVNFIRLDYTSYANTNLGQTTLHESIEEETKVKIRELLASDMLFEEIKRFTDDSNLNQDKANHFLTVHIQLNILFHT